jgi:NAD(P)-dependent dehydrogenase (short-subunit alcohol dehydrogenase family)
MTEMDLKGKTVLITGAGRRIGRSLALTIAQQGAEVLLHYGSSQEDAEKTAAQIRALDGKVELIQADLGDPQQITVMMAKAVAEGKLDVVVNNAAIFEPLDWQHTDITSWNRHLSINLTAPFLISQAFAMNLPEGKEGRIVNILDWRALRPSADHLPYTISKAGLAALTRSLAQALSPRITVNGLALGAILSPSDGSDTDEITKHVPAGRWAKLEEVGQALVFLLTGPSYITGEILHIDGGRHLV